MRAQGRRFIVAVACFAVLAWAGATWADVIYTGTGAGRGLRQDVDILGVENGELIFLINGNRATAPLGRVMQIELDGDAGFNNAEQAFSAGDWPKAAAGYATAARGHATAWVRRRAAERLLQAAGNGGQVELAVTGYVQLALQDAPAAVGREPDLSAATPEQLERVAGEVQQALETRGLTPVQQKPLLTFLLAVHNKRGDQASAGRVVERLVGVVGNDPGEDPKLFAQVLLGRASLALSQNKPAEAARLINDNAAIFADPQQQSEALMTLARAAEAGAGEDRGRLMDAALAYMKVVAHFRRVEGTPNVPEALLRVGLIHERIARPDAAADVYQDVVTRYPESPAAVEAQKRLSTLPPRTPTTRPGT